MTGTLRVDKDGELEGIDIAEHGTPAYHMEFGQGFSYTTLGATSMGLGQHDVEEEDDEAPKPVPSSSVQ